MVQVFGLPFKVGSLLGHNLFVHMLITNTSKVDTCLPYFLEFLLPQYYIHSDFVAVVNIQSHYNVLSVFLQLIYVKILI